MISSASDYRYVSGDLDRIIINGGIMPLRSAADKKILRGEDITFLMEGGIERKRMMNGSSYVRGYSSGHRSSFAFDAASDLRAFTRKLVGTQAKDAHDLGYALNASAVYTAAGDTMKVSCLASAPTEHDLASAATGTAFALQSSSPFNTMTPHRLLMSDISEPFAALATLTDSGIVLHKNWSVRWNMNWTEDELVMHDRQGSGFAIPDPWPGYNCQQGEDGRSFFTVPPSDMTVATLSAEWFSAASLWSIVTANISGDTYDVTAYRLMKVADAVAAGGALTMTVPSMWYVTATERMFKTAGVQRMIYNPSASFATQQCEIHEDFHIVAAPIIRTRW